MKPKSIRRIDDGDKIVVDWGDGHESIFLLKFLRDICPCANCKGEDILFEHLNPASKTSNPHQYEIVNINQVGSYAIQIEWGDGHNTGIYSWEYLYENCSCEECSKSKHINT